MYTRARRKDSHGKQAATASIVSICLVSFGTSYRHQNFTPQHKPVSSCEANFLQTRKAALRLHTSLQICCRYLSSVLCVECVPHVTQGLGSCTWETPGTTVVICHDSRLMNIAISPRACTVSRHRKQPSRINA